MFSSITLKRLSRPLLLAAATLGGLAIVGSRPTAGSTSAASSSRRLSTGSLLLQTDTIPPPCHPNSQAQHDMTSVANRGDVKSLPLPLRQQLVRIAGRPHSVLPVQALSESDHPDQLFQYYLLDTHNF